MNKPAESIKTIWSLRTFIRYLINSLLLFVVERFFISPNIDLPFSPGILPGALLFVGTLLAFILPYFRYKYWFFDVRDDEIYIQYGIFTRVKTFVPYNRIQHLDVRQSFFERMLHLSSLVLYTAGSVNSDLVIPGLPEEYAESLRIELKNITSEDEV